jgi:hypothetical protein
MAIHGIGALGFCHGCGHKIVEKIVGPMSQAQTEEGVPCRETAVTLEGKRLWLCQRCEDTVFVIILDSINAPDEAAEE